MLDELVIEMLLELIVEEREDLATELERTKISQVPSFSPSYPAVLTHISAAPDRSLINRFEP